MAPSTDLVELASELAEIASRTTDPQTARLLLDMASRLLTEAGLPHYDAGGGDLPPGPLHAMAVDLPEFA